MPHHQHRLTGLDEKIPALSARGMSTVISGSTCRLV
ncbi:hypothetical protein [Leptothoe sp. PORK10 BA2]